MHKLRYFSVTLLLLLVLGATLSHFHLAQGQQAESRKTSKPYTGDLSIFDSPGRDQRLQINRVMDILGIN
ncbi:MAG: hypothetical protein JOZ80_14440, partial [Acidobacteriaceae bacterium]|nr:hypothetical protein [Acidobacteriaceae bacterium]